MKKYIKNILLPLLCLLTMTACSRENMQQPATSANTAASSADALQNENDGNVSASKGNGELNAETAEEANSEEKEHADIYKRFLKNEEKVLIDCSGDIGKVFSLKNAEGKELTLLEVA